MDGQEKAALIAMLAIVGAMIGPIVFALGLALVDDWFN